ncbi:MAG: 50S ribosomal protein L17 [Owenweeksia sp.]|nr:50S ribosomal protein L17 [Owenweeksia sp.]
MRHGKKFNHLGRTAAHRKAMLANMASSLIEHKRINTTVAKAKALKQYVEPLITKSKDDNTHSRRIVFSYLQNKTAVSELFREVADKVGDRPGGYTRIIKTGNRLGDNAEMCMVELVDFNDIYTNEKEEKKGKTRRSRRGGSSSKAAAPKAAADAKTKSEDKKPAEEEKPEAKTEEAPKAEPKDAKSEQPKKEEKKESKTEEKEICLSSNF